MLTRSTRSFVALAVACFAVACTQDFEPFRPGNGGNGGNGGTPSNGGGGNGGEGGQPVGGNGGEGGTGGMPECDVPEDCPTPPICKGRACNDNTCSEPNLPARDPCVDGTATLCDGNGNCVECIDNNDCTPPATCSGTNNCVSPLCMNNMKDPGETDVDCGGGCDPCMIDDECLVGTDCVTGFCDVGENPATCQPCGATSDCAATDYCNPATDVCELKLPMGSMCSDDGFCSSNFCRDSRCCNEDCAGTCRACSNAKTGQTDGTCTFVTGGQDFDNECPTAANACQANTCSGTAAACGNAAAGTACGTVSCTDATLPGQEIHPTCDAGGNCSGTPMTVSCHGHKCNGTACDTDCGNSDSQCISPYTCDNPSDECLGAQGNTCEDNTDCANGRCVDGFCCDTTCTGLCKTCDASKQTGGTPGVCGNISTGTDPDNECAGTDTCNASQMCAP